jgi:hypothetical protein
MISFCRRLEALKGAAIRNKKTRKSAHFIQAVLLVAYWSRSTPVEVTEIWRLGLLGWVNAEAVGHRRGSFGLRLA